MTEAQRIVQSVAQVVQEHAHKKIASVVTRCLKAVFGDSAYEFKIEFVRRRGKTEAELSFVRYGETVDPKSVGGGVVDTASFALRVACLLMKRPTKRKLLILDEPWKYLSRDYHPRAAELLETLADEFAIQIVMVTHSPDLILGKVVDLGGSE